MTNVKGRIFNIQRFSIHDGPGIRTILFMKGCSLRCKWCCNPESIRREDEIGYSTTDCIHCGNCIAACPYGAITAMLEKLEFHLGKCLTCVEKPCVTACPAKAIALFGRSITVEEALAEIERDRSFYRRSGGGVTFAGGEPLLQAEFVREVSRACFSANINTAIETSCCCSWRNIEQVIPYTDLFLCDIKHLKDDKYREEIGPEYSIALENIQKLALLHNNIIIRIPVIPGFNDDVETIEKIVEYAVNLKAKAVHLLPYHRLGQSKYAKLAQKYIYADIEAPDQKHMQTLCTAAAQYGIPVQNGG